MWILVVDQGVTFPLRCRLSGWARARWRRRARGACECKRSPPPDDARGRSPLAPRRSTARTMLNMKLKERLALALSAFLVLFTLMLIVDLQMDYGISGHRVPLHGRVKIGDDEDKGRSAYIEFRKRFLQKRLVFVIVLCVIFSGSMCVSIVFLIYIGGHSCNCR